MMKDVLEVAGWKTQAQIDTDEFEPTDTFCAALQKLEH